MVASFLSFQIFEDVHLHERPTLAKTLEILNYIFAAIFSAEFVLKIIGFGLVKYMSSPWNCLDAFIVSVSSRATLRLCFYFFINDFQPVGLVEVLFALFGKNFHYLAC